MQNFDNNFVSSSQAIYHIIYAKIRIFMCQKKLYSNSISYGNWDKVFVTTNLYAFAGGCILHILHTHTLSKYYNAYETPAYQVYSPALEFSQNPSICILHLSSFKLISIFQCHLACSLIAQVNCYYYLLLHMKAVDFSTLVQENIINQGEMLLVE